MGQMDFSGEESSQESNNNILQLGKERRNVIEMSFTKH